MRPKLDPELGFTKKDDDLYIKGARAPTGWRARGSPRLPPRKTFKRLGLVFLLAAVVYVFVHNIPTDLGPQDKRHPFYTYGGAQQNSNPPSPPIPNEIPEQETTALAARDYDGPVRFLELAESLHAISETKGATPNNRNVLFMASTIQSANKLLPIACQMGRELRSYVHFALVSRNDIPIRQLRDMNGIGEDCHVIFHDARPELPSLSTDERFEKSISRGLYHVNNYMHPQAILVDAEAEELAFLKSARASVAKLNLPAPLIELPANAEDRLSWITKLDAASLQQWNRLNVNILIHAHTDASGSLIRLLKSLSEADFTACAVPHLTIELPEQIDPPTQQFLQDFRWPPRSAQNPAGNVQLTLRHRISRHGLSEEESSVRFLESFWPANPAFSHVLVLSPQVELSPNFFHYLKMTILEYRYSTQALAQAWDKRLFGISLDVPSTSISGSPFAPPTKTPAKTDGSPGSQSVTGAPTSFLWQAPNSNAVLFTGEKWAELHNFVSQTLEAQHSASSPLTLLTEKSVSKDYPAWMEHGLRLCRAKGYWTMYPSPQVAANLATVHNELYHQPEEYETGGALSRHDDEDEIVIHKATLLDSLPNNGLLPRFQEMPLLTWDGTKTTVQELDEAAVAYTHQFRNTVGGCEGVKMPQTAGFLFCSGEAGI